MAGAIPAPQEATSIKKVKKGPPGAFDVASQAGVCAPWGEAGVEYWDPAGLAEGIDAATFREYRTAELKHGRVAMVAIVGLIAQHTWRFNLLHPYEPGPADLSGAPSGIAAAWSYPSGGFFGILVMMSGLHEVIFTDDGRDPGDFGDPLNFEQQYGLDFGDKDDKKAYQTYELNHGRLAMFGAIGTMLAEYTSGYDAIGQWEHFDRGVARTFALTIPTG